MAGYADPEVLIAGWLHTALGVKAWADPSLPDDRFIAPLAHVQRAPGQDDAPLTIDVAVLDIDVYAAVADHARDTASAIKTAMLLQLPLTTFSNGVFVKGVNGGNPIWAPDPSVYRRTAAYTVTLHGLVA